MAIHFPNSSRSFDENKNRVCFWGYDETIEITFYVGIEALQKIRSGVGTSEPELLAAFDASVDRIHQVAVRVYANSSKGRGTYTYILHAEDF